MLTERPEGPSCSAQIPRTIIVGMGTVVLLAVCGLLYDATAGFTTGTVRNVCPQDASLLEKIRSAGVSVMSDDGTCRFGRCINVKVRWDYDRDAYCVHSLTTRSGSLETIEPLLPQFAALKSLNFPDATPSERARITAQYPHLAVSANRSSATARANSWPWGDFRRRGC